MNLSGFDPFWAVVAGMLVGVAFSSAIWAWRYNVKIRAAFEDGLTQDAEKNTHLAEHEQLVRREILEGHGPGIEKRRLDVEQDEQHRHQVEMHRVAMPADPCVGLHAALVGRLVDRNGGTEPAADLRARATDRVDPVGRCDHPPRHAGRDQNQQQHRKQAIAQSMLILQGVPNSSAVVECR